MAAKGQDGLPVRGYQVTRAEVRHLLDRLRKMPLKDRAGVPGLSPDRADIIVAGLAIVDRIMDRFEVNTVQVHNRGVRDGLLLTMIDQSLGTIADQPRRPRRGASSGWPPAAAARWPTAGTWPAGRLDLHATGRDLRARPAGSRAARSGRQAARRGLPDQLRSAPQAQLPPDPEQPAGGFQPNELELIANVARYHRGADPKRKHANFRQLSAHDQQRVRQMAAILRVAGGLDRSNTQQVSDVTVELGKKGGITSPRDRRAVSRSRYLGRAQAQQAVRKSLRHAAGMEWSDVAEQHSHAPTAGSNGKAAIPGVVPTGEAG